MDNTDKNIFEVPANTVENPLQYDVGEVCKCYFTEILKNVSSTISQQINKCQSFCRVIEKHPEESKEYTVKLFDTDGTVKKLPGRCLRKVKLVPYTYKEAISKIGSVIESNEGTTEHITMGVTVVEDGDADCDVEVNSISVKELMKDFHFRSTGAPFCSIVMLKADEAFTDKTETID